MVAAGVERLPIVGRDGELATLCGPLDALRRGDPGAVLLQGEAGIGKSRLVAELIDKATAAGLRSLTGAAEDHLKQRPFSAITAAVGLVPHDAGRSALAGLLANDGSDGHGRDAPTCGIGSSTSSRRSCARSQSWPPSCWSSRTCTGRIHRRCWHCDTSSTRTTSLFS